MKSSSSMKRNVRRIMALGFIAWGLAATAFAAGSKISRDLAGVSREATVDVIVQFTATPTARHHEKVTRLGGTLKREFSMVKAGHYSIPASKLEDLANDPEVAYISPDRAVHGTLNFAVPAIGGDTAFSSGFSGSGIGVAIADSGFSAVDDLETWNKSKASR